MAKFDIAFEITTAHEGGYVNDPFDRGGETFCGISRKFWPNWEGWVLIDKFKKNSLDFSIYLNSNELKLMVRSFYKSNFWDIHKMDLCVNQEIANEVYDTAVNCGNKTSAEFLQRAINVTNRGGKDAPDVKFDGNCGSNTIKALNSHKRPWNVLKVMNILQGNKYVEIAERDKTQERFVNGWLNRVSL